MCLVVSEIIRIPEIVQLKTVCIVINSKMIKPTELWQINSLLLTPLSTLEIEQMKTLMIDTMGQRNLAKSLMCQLLSLLKEFQ